MKKKDFIILTPLSFLLKPISSNAKVLILYIFARQDYKYNGEPWTFRRTDCLNYLSQESGKPISKTTYYKVLEELEKHKYAFKEQVSKTKVQYGFFRIDKKLNPTKERCPISRTCYEKRCPILGTKDVPDLGHIEYNLPPKGGEIIYNKKNNIIITNTNSQTSPQSPCALGAGSGLSNSEPEQANKYDNLNILSENSIGIAPISQIEAHIDNISTIGDKDTNNKKIWPTESKLIMQNLMNFLETGK